MWVDSQGAVKIGRGTSVPVSCNHGDDGGGYDYSTLFILDTVADGPALYACDKETSTFQLAGGAGGGGGATPSLQAVATVGRVINDAITASPLRVGGVSYYWDLFHDEVNNDTILKATCNDVPCLNTSIRLNSSGAFQVTDNAATPNVIASLNDSGVFTYAHQRVIDWGAGAWLVDGTICKTPAEASPRGERAIYVVCDPVDTDGLIEFKAALDGSASTGGTLTVELYGLNADATQGGSFNMAVSAKCEPSDGTAAIAYGTAANIELDFSSSSQNGWVLGSTTVTPGGTCNPRSVLSLKMAMLAGPGDNDVNDISQVYLLSQMTYFNAARLSAE